MYKRKKKQTTTQLTNRWKQYFIIEQFVAHTF